jgi:VWFA-related protein
VVVTDRSGRVVSGLTADDFELFEGGKKQQIVFFEYVGKVKQIRLKGEAPKPEEAPLPPQGPGEADLRRIIAFVIDDLTIRNEDLYYVRQMLGVFVEKHMEPTDLVAIVRTVGGRGLLQQFTTSKEMLSRAITSLNPSSHRLNTFSDPSPDPSGQRAQPLNDAVGDVAGMSEEGADVNEGDTVTGDINKMLRAYMSLGTASFVIDSMKELPGRKSLVLVSGGLPLLDVQAGTAVGDVSHFVNQLSDKATRAGVAIHTMDLQGLSGQTGVARFNDTPARSMIPTAAGGFRTGRGNSRPGFGRGPDENMLGNNNILEEQLGLKAIATNTGGIAVMNRNSLNEGLEKIVEASDGYYLLAYTPPDSKFDGKFRKVDVKVKRAGLKVYSRRGYLAREDKGSDSVSSKQDQLLKAIKSPLARRDVEMDAMLLYKALPQAKGAIDIHLLIDSKKLNFEKAEGKHLAKLDIAGFVFDEMGKLRGGFSDTIDASLSELEYARVSKGGLTYSANTTLPAGAYQIRLAVRDNKTGSIGTMSRYLEVPDLSEGRLSASSLLLGAVPANDTKATNPLPLGADRRISRNHDLRYALLVYNARLKDGAPRLRCQLAISQNRRVIFKQAEEPVEAAGEGGEQFIKIGQLGLGRVSPGRYTLTLTVTDPLADKRSQIVVRNMDFIVVD